MIDRAKVGWGFEVQRFKIVPQKDGDLWIPNSRLITGPNIVIDDAQEELLKIWRAISGSVRQIQSIAVGSGLTAVERDDTALETELDSKNIDSWDDSSITPVAGLSTVKAEVTWLSLEAVGRISEIGLKFDNGALVTHALFKRLNVFAASQANPVVIGTGSAGSPVVAEDHGLSTGDEIHLDNLGGMTELNDRDFVITKVDDNEFSLDGEDGTGHTAYTSGGQAWLVVTKTTGEVVQTNYVLSMQS